MSDGEGHSAIPSSSHNSNSNSVKIPTVPPPEKFNFQDTQSWPNWLRRFERYRSVSGLCDEAQEKQINTLIYVMGSESEDIYRSFNLVENTDMTYAEVKQKFNEFFIVRKNVIFERAQFNSRSQKEGESVDSFITSLYPLTEHCEYGELREELIRDRIVVGIKDEKLSRRLQLDSSLTLKKAIDAVKQSETVISQNKVLREETVNADINVTKATVFKKSKKQIPNQKFKDTKKTGNQDFHRTSQSDKCHRCGKQKHRREDCPASSSKCRKCQKVGHWEKLCQSKRVFSVKTAYNTHSPELTFLGYMTTSNINMCYTEDIFKCNAYVDKAKIDFKLDTGAEVTSISEKVYFKIRSLNSKIKLRRPNRVLYGPSREVLYVIGMFSADIRIGDRISKQDIFVVKNLSVPLLGVPAIIDLKLLQCNNVNSISTDESIVSKVDAELRSPYVDRYPKLFTGLGKLKGQYTIRLRPDAIPYSVVTSRAIKLPQYEKLKTELNNLLDEGVISRVDNPTDWCFPIVPIDKDDGRIRLCVDFTMLNKNVLVENYLLPTVESTLGQLSEACIMSKLDANSGFFQISLSPESRALTTFMTPFGRFSFNRLPFGINSAPEYFQKRMSQLLDGFAGVLCHMDDILVFGRTQSEHDKRLNQVLEKLQNSGLTLNLSKCKFSQTRVKFLGHIISRNGIEPDPDKLKAISEMDAPTDIHGIRRILGVIHQLGKFTPNLAEISQPLRELLSPKTEFQWTIRHQKSFDNIKVELCSSKVLKHYNPNHETKISADASQFGLGAALFQRINSEDMWKPVIFASRTMTSAEQNYPQIDKEALGVTWACDKFSDFLIGIRFHIETDHKPLISLLGTKCVNELPARIQRFRLRLFRYKYTISHVPGNNLLIADTLSRAPLLNSAEKSDLELSRECEAMIAGVLKTCNKLENRLIDIKKQQEIDPVCIKIKQYVKEGWPHRINLNEAVRAYWPVRHEISLLDNILMRGSRILIPSCMRLDILNKLHEGHMGVTKCRERAIQSVWWPNLSSQIADLIYKCSQCAEHRDKQFEPLLPTEFPNRPWQIVGSDLYYCRGKTYLLVIDYFSRFIEIAKLTYLSSKEVILHLKSFFARHGIPETVRSDNGPQYSSLEFKNFAKEYEFDHVTSSPLYPQSNGAAEKAVKTVKNLIKKSKDPYKALLSYRTTPLHSGFSPAELLFGRRLRSQVPTPAQELLPKWPYLSLVREREEKYKAQSKFNFDKRHKANDLSDLAPGDNVFIKDRKSQGTIIRKHKYPRSFIVKTSDGYFRRNRQNLVPCQEPYNDFEENDFDDQDNNNEQIPHENCIPDHDSNSNPIVENKSNRVLRKSKRIRKPVKRLISEI